MFGKKKAGKCQMFETFDVEFKSLSEFCRNNTDSGDWIISLAGETTIKKSHDVVDPEAVGRVWANAVDPQDFIPEKKKFNDYDERLLTVYQHQDDELVLKDVSKLARKDPKKKGLIYDIRFIAVEKIDSFISSLPEKAVKKWSKKLEDIYDAKMKDSFSGKVNETFIWIPLWKVDSEDAFVINILKRVSLIFT